MTVICTDGVTVASDSLTTFGDERGLRPSQKIMVKGGRIYAASGVMVLPELVAWHIAGADPRKLPVTGGREEWSMLVFAPSQINFYHSDVPYPLRIDPPFALGSAGDFALGAIDHGASPEQAVAIAMRRSIKCGGPIQVVNIAEALGLQTVKEAAE